MKTQSRYAVAALFILAATDTASAASLNGSFGVSSTVSAACQNLATNAVSFGVYSPFAAADVTTSATMTVTCTNSTAFS